MTTCLQSFFFINLRFVDGNLELTKKVTESCLDHFKAIKVSGWLRKLSK